MRLTGIKDSIYAKLLAKSLPRPIRSEAEHERLTATLLALDERDDLSPEEEALAEVRAPHADDRHPVADSLCHAYAPVAFQK